MYKTILIAGLAASFASQAVAQPARTSLNDVIADMCSASDTDLIGKRLARQCREQVREAYRRDEAQFARMAADKGRSPVAVGAVSQPKLALSR